MRNKADQQNDLWFNGGNIGMKLSGQQWVIKNTVFAGTTTGIVAGGTDIVLLGCQFNNGKTGIDATGTSGSLTVIDSSGSGLESFLISSNPNGAGNAIVLENIQNTGITVNLGGQAVVSGSVPNTWVRGDMVRHLHHVIVDSGRLTVLIVCGGKPKHAASQRADGDYTTIFGASKRNKVLYQVTPNISGILQGSGPEYQVCAGSAGLWRWSNR
jgi:hypothetical protein